jgi:transposase
VVLEEDPQVEEIIARVAALDIGKAELVCCVRVPHEGKPGRRLQEVETYSTMTRSLLGMVDHLRCLGVTRVVMEATSDYWKPVFYLLEAQGLEPWLVNARDVKHLPGRPKTDKLDAVWLCKVAERQMLQEAFYGHFTDHHGFLLRKMLTRVDALTDDITELDAVIEELISPFIRAVEQIDEIPGFGPIAAAGVIAEIGLDMSRFPTAGHLASWAKYAPGVSESAGKKKGRGSTGHGNRYLARILGEAAVIAGGTDTFLGERYRRIARRRGKKKAIVAVGRSMLVIIWHLLSDPAARYRDLGSDFYVTHINAERRKRNHIHQLEALGYRVTVEPAA